jgi:hypothetical protein
MKVIENLGQAVSHIKKGPTYTTEIVSVIDDYDKPAFLAVTKKQDKGPNQLHAIQTIGKSGFEDLSFREVESVIKNLDESKAKLPEFSKKAMTNKGAVLKKSYGTTIPEEHQKAITDITDNYTPPSKQEEKAEDEVKEKAPPQKSTLETKAFTGAFQGYVVSDDLVALTHTDETGKKEMLVVSQTQRSFDYLGHAYAVAEFDLETGKATKPEDHKLSTWKDRILEHDKNPEKNPAYEPLNHINRSILTASSSHRMLPPNSQLNVRREFDLPSPEIVKTKKQFEEQKKNSVLNVDGEQITIVGMNSNETHTAILAESSTTGGNKIIIVPKENYPGDKEITFVTMDENKANSMNPKGLIIHHLSPKDSNTKAEMEKWIYDIEDFVKEAGLDEGKKNEIMLNTIAPLNNAIHSKTKSLPFSETSKIVDELFKDEKIKSYKKAKENNTAPKQSTDTHASKVPAKSSIKSTFDPSLGESCALQRKDMPGKTMLVLAPNRIEENDEIRIGAYDHETGNMSKTSFKEVDEWRQVIENEAEKHYDVQILRRISRRHEDGFNLEKMNMVGGTAADVMDKNGISYQHFPKMTVDLSKTKKRTPPPPRNKQRKPAGINPAKKIANTEYGGQSVIAGHREHDWDGGKGYFTFRKPSAFPNQTLVITTQHNDTDIGASVINHQTRKTRPLEPEENKKWFDEMSKVKLDGNAYKFASQHEAMEVLNKISKQDHVQKVFPDHECPWVMAKCKVAEPKPLTPEQQTYYTNAAQMQQNKTPKPTTTHRHTSGARDAAPRAQQASASSSEPNKKPFIGCNDPYLIEDVAIFAFQVPDKFPSKTLIIREDHKATKIGIVNHFTGEIEEAPSSKRKEWLKAVQEAQRAEDTGTLANQLNALDGLEDLAYDAGDVITLPTQEDAAEVFSRLEKHGLKRPSTPQFANRNARQR